VLEVYVVGSCPGSDLEQLSTLSGSVTTSAGVANFGGQGGQGGPGSLELDDLPIVWGVPTEVTLSLGAVAKFTATAGTVDLCAHFCLDAFDGIGSVTIVSAPVPEAAPGWPVGLCLAGVIFWSVQTKAKRSLIFLKIQTDPPPPPR
jgi:hypothetical protein